MKIQPRLDHQSILLNQPTPVHMALALTGDEPPASGAPPKPVAFCAVIDRSGSMGGVPLENAKEAARGVLRHMRSEDLFALVTFDHEARVLVPLQKPADREALARRIAAIDSGGSTNLAGGWALGRDELTKAPEGLPRRLLLLTDGHLNVGITDRAMVRAIAAEGLERRAIRTSCLGFGDKYDEDLLVALSTATGGEFHDAKIPERFPAIFEAEIGGLQQISAQNVRVRARRLTFCDRAALLSDYPTVNLPDGRTEIAVGDLIGGETRTLVLALGVLPLPLMADGNPPASLEGEELLDLEVLWDEILPGEIRSCRQAQVIRVLGVQDPADIRRDEEVIAAVAYHRAGKAVHEGARQIDEGRLDAALRTLEGAIGELRAYGGERVADSVRLVQESLTRLREDGGATARGRKIDHYKASKLRRMSSKMHWSPDITMDRPDYIKEDLAPPPAPPAPETGPDASRAPSDPSGS